MLQQLFCVKLNISIQLVVAFGDAEKDMMAQESGVGLAVVNAMLTLKTAWHDRTYKT